MSSKTQSNVKKYFFEKDRLESFKSWPFSDKQKCSVKKMAEAGFYWCGTVTENDTASCFLCGKVLDGWESTDDPWLEHKKHAPQCAFVKLGQAERSLTVAEQLDLMDVYVQKIRDEVAAKATKTATEKSNEARENLKQALKTS